MKDHREAFFCLEFVSALGAALFHGGTAVVGSGYIVVRLIYDARKDKFHITTVNLIAGILVGVVFFFLFINFTGLFFLR